MINVNLKLFPLLWLDTIQDSGKRQSLASEELLQALENEGLKVIATQDHEDLLMILKSKSDPSSLLLSLEYFPKDHPEKACIDFIKRVRIVNPEIPILILTQSVEINLLNMELLHECQSILWRYDDTPAFVAGRIRQQVFKYLVSLLPPFFKALVKYTLEYKYAWHTPGHMGGVAFLKSPTGRLFYDFYGENAFRSDLSISVPELGSLLEHSGVVGEAEAYAAQVFGADETFFVTNGTSTSNKVVMMSVARKNDLAIIDRNCHKSLQHALTMSDVIPIYFKPSRNAYGIIGGIAKAEFSPEVIRKKILACPLVDNKEMVPRLAVITNSTYDGLIYNVDAIKTSLSQSGIDFIHFDEAWFPYGRFHPFYQDKFAMSSSRLKNPPTIFSTQSTHKLLAAFSQASMLHVKQGSGPLEKEILNESFMMHTSTSPQYSIIASLDVSSRMMAGASGTRLLGSAMATAIAFRQEFSKVNFKSNPIDTADNWSFKLWQPDEVGDIILDEDCQFLPSSNHGAGIWKLSAQKPWHGFLKMDEDHLFLDPIKVTLLTPGINASAESQAFGIPAPIISRYLIRNGVLDEKTGFYSLLFLFSIGVNKSKALTLLMELTQFKELFNQGAPLQKIFPQLTQRYHQRYAKMNLLDLAHEMHAFLSQRNAAHLLMNAYDSLPEQVLTPNAAYQALISGRRVALGLDELQGQVVLTMVAPYPPGIPIIMPGEKVTADQVFIIDFLKLLQDFDNAFPGFENEVHGAKIEEDVQGQRRYLFYCLDET